MSSCRMFTQDMPHFESHGLRMGLEKDPLSGHLFNATGSYWKNLRVKLTPIFTSGKLKVMYRMMEQTGTLLQDLVADSAARAEDIEVIDVLARFATDVIGSVAFGLEINSIDDGDSQFRNMSKKIFEPNTLSVFVFFLGGFETSSSTASLALYLLALHPEAQDRARREVLEVLKKHVGKFTYEALGDMEYLGKVINETLRKYSVLNILFRKCTADYVIPGTDVQIDKGTMVLMPIDGVHNDPELWEEPDKFDPDRFTPERRPENLTHIYMPFGQGPRICIGQRFGILQTKLALSKLLAKYKFEPSELTKVPLELHKPGSTPTINPAGGIHLRIRHA